MNSYDSKLKNEIIKFIKTNFNINVENYSDEKLKELIISLTNFLDEKIDKERIKGFKLMQQLTESQMLMVLEESNKNST